jgi:site-specific DNA recombinase
MKRAMSHKLYLGYINYNGEDYKADHVPIIDEETFNRANELLAERKENYIHTGLKPGAQSTYLGGLLYCKHCGGKYAKCHGGSRKYGTLYYYACYSRSKKVKKMVKDPNCKNKYWKMEALNELVFDEIRKLAIDSEYIHEIRENKSNASDTPNKIDIINKEIDTLNNQISRFMDLYGVGAFTIDQVSEKVEPLNARKNNLIKELENLNAESGELSVDNALQIIESFDEVLERGDFNEIRLIIEKLIYYIELDEDDVYIHWKFA